MTGEGFALFEERMAKPVNGGMGFDPSVILGLITAIIPLITQCFKPTPAGVRKRFGNRAKLAVCLRRETGMGMLDAFRAADQCFDVADKATDSELQSFIDDCCSGTPVTMGGA